MILDASALLALLNDESGADEVRAAISQAKMSTVNVAEVVGKLADYGMPDPQIRRVLELGFARLPFSEEETTLMGEVRRATRNLGLSLGDRCCLASALTHGEAVLTADRAWEQVNIRGLRVQVLKERRRAH